MSADSGTDGRRLGYRAIAQELRRRIEAQEVVDRLPAESALVDEFNVARETVRRALALLVEEKLVRASHGRGHFIRTGDDVGPTPRYSVIAEDLQKQIHSGQLKVGDRLKSESEIQAAYSVSRTTARRAFQELESRGFIVREQGKRLVRKSRNAE